MRLTIRLKIIVFIVIPVLAIYLGIFGYGMVQLRDRARVNVEMEMTQLALHYGSLLDAHLREAAQIATSTASFMETDPGITAEQAYAQLKANVAQNPLVYGAAIAFTPYEFHPDRRLFCPYVFRGEEGLVQMDIGTEAYDYTEPQWQWWRDPVQQDRPVWTAPYFDEGAGNVLMTTYSVPVHRDGAVWGVTTVDIQLEPLHAMIDPASELDLDFVVVTADGQYVYHRDRSRIVDDSLFRLAEREQREDLRELAERITSGGSGVIEVAGWDDEEVQWVFYAPVSSADWAFAARVARGDALAFVDQQALTGLRLMLISLLLIILAVWFVSGRISRPVQKLTQAARAVTAGNLDVEVKPQSRDEVGDLAISFGEMTKRLAQRDRSLREARDQLEKRVEERTTELTSTNARLRDEVEERRRTEQALLQARDAAEAANRAKSEFLSNMSHELRTPLNGVLGYAQILQRDTSCTGRQKESLEAIETCGQHLLGLINNVLDLSKIESGGVEAEPVPTDLAGLLAGVRDIVAPRADHKGLTLILDVAPNVPRGVVVDGRKLRQVLVNLLGNAVKFTATGQVALRVREFSDGLLEFQVEDTGMGIPADRLDDIFDPFKQAEGGQVEGGTGLGLAISRRIVAILGGEMTVESTPGSGSRFTFTLPMEEVPDNDVKEWDEVPLSDGGHLRLAPGQAEVKVLVADDRYTNRDVLMHLLEPAGFRTVEARNGREALRLLREQHMPLVLMDIRMPEMDGLEATRAIRADPELRRTVVIAVTASVFPDFQARLREAGCDDVIGKPFRVREIFSKIQRHLGLRFVDASEAKATDRPVDADASLVLDADLVAAWRPRLVEAAEVGDVSELTAIAEELVSSGGETARLGERVRALADNFNFEGVRALAEGLEADDSSV